MTLGPCFLPVSQSAIKHSAIAVGKTAPRYLHNVLLYRTGKHIRGLHICIDGTVSSERAVDLTQQYAWAIPKLSTDPRVSDIYLKQIAAYCTSIGERPRHLTYSFRIDRHSKLAKRSDHFVILGADGLTCSTLVLAIFQYLDIPFLDLDTWTVNETDTEWQLALLADMRRWRDNGQLQITDVELQARRDEIPCARYSPAMVIGACRAGNHPSNCSVALDAGRELVEWLDESLALHA